MIEQDTIRLLRECDAGVKMGTDSIAEVVDDVESQEFQTLLDVCLQDPHRLCVQQYCERS